MITLSFYHKSGLWVSALPVYYHNTTETSYDIDLMLGYQRFFKKHIELSAYYTYHHYQSSSDFNALNYHHSADLSLGFDFSWLYLYAEGYSYYGKTNNYFTDLGLSFYYSTPPIFGNNDYLSLMPILSVSFGTDDWFFEDMSDWEERYYLTLFKKEGYKTQNFGFYCLNLNIPVIYQIDDISISATYDYSIPAEKYKVVDWQNQWGLMFSLAYTLNFD